MGLGALMWMAIASAHAWEVHRGSLPGDAYTLSSRGSPAAEFKEVLAAEKGRLHGIFLGRLVGGGSNADTSAMQSDIVNHLRKKHPRLLDGALRSAGNLHNPKVVALQPAFEEAVLHSAYVAELNATLNPAGYRVTGVESEKFFLLKGEAERGRFDALVWLEVEVAVAVDADPVLPRKKVDGGRNELKVAGAAISSQHKCTQSATQAHVETECRDALERKQENAVNQWTTDFPPVLTALHQLDVSVFESIDYEPLDRFHSPQDNRSWFQAWTGNSEVDGAQFRVFADDGTGGYAAFWLVRSGAPMGEQPIVFLGSEGARGVVARNLDEYLWLLAGGVGPMEAVEYGEQGAQDARRHARLTAFAKANSRANHMSANEVLLQSKAAYPDFSTYIDGLCR